eukprot:Hpha_TRINITY_DN3776_c0_g1::TRINITY_DN3776_c0_g1_i1::g.23764::m.23764/K01620/ltaE; threonine aldolase
MLLHVDGARFHSVVVANKGISPKKLLGHADIFSLGGTKNGMAAGEAVVITNSSGVASTREAHGTAKQLCQVPSKHRFLAAQWIGYMFASKWKERALKANDAARKLAESIESRSQYTGCSVEVAETNLVFVEMPERVFHDLQSQFAVYLWEERGAGRVLARFCCNWQTTHAEISAVSKAIRELSAKQ